MITRPRGSVSREAPNRENRISVLAAKNLKLVTFAFKMIGHCSKPYDIRHVSKREVLNFDTNKCKKRDDRLLELPKVEKINLAKTIEGFSS